MTAVLSEPINLTPMVQHYAWGMQGECAVKRLAGIRAENPPYAELWLGSHHLAPSRVEYEGATLTLDKLMQLPWLFKILSVASGLSLQAHPDKTLAAQLHARDPEHYPDANHKPEIAIALTEFKLLHGFLPIAEIAANLNHCPELRALAGDALTQRVLSNAAAGRNLLQALSSAVFRAEPSVVHDLCRKIHQRLETATSLRPAERWILKLRTQYPDSDAGLFGFYLMNLVTLEPGQGLYTPPNTLHAYLSGELAECMTNSDNVVRAGLTAKFKDTETLLGMLNYEASNAPVIQSSHRELNGFFITTYPTPAGEFEVSTLVSVDGRTRFSADHAPQLIFCICGSAQVRLGGKDYPLQAGNALLIPSGTSPYELGVQNARLFRVTTPRA